MSTPMDLFEVMRDKGVTMAQTAFMESEKEWPTDQGTVDFIKTMIGIGVAAASEHFAQNPELLALAGSAICTECRGEVQTLTVGVEHDADGKPLKIAWPCGHQQDVES